MSSLGKKYMEREMSSVRERDEREEAVGRETEEEREERPLRQWERKGELQIGVRLKYGALENLLKKYVLYTKCTV